MYVPGYKILYAHMQIPHLVLKTCNMSFSQAAATMADGLIVAPSSNNACA